MAEVDASRLREAFIEALTVDGPTTDRRRREYNQAVFMADGEACWSSTTLDMVMDKFDRAVKILKKEKP